MRTAFQGAGGAYRADIDGIRALAVLAVLVFHAFPSALPGGFVGVDVFFVISGYLISGIIFSGLADGSFTFAGFYGRRIRRILPALILLLSASLALGWFVLLPDRFLEMGRNTAAAAAFVSNFVFWRASGYFDSAVEQKVLLHLWSLAIEEQFYIWWPLLLVIAHRLRARVQFVILTAGIVSFVWAVRATGHEPSGAFYSPLTRAWELMLGAAWAYDERRSLGPRVSGMFADFLAILGLGLIAGAAIRLNSNSVFPGSNALAPTVGTALVIAAGPSSWLNRFVLGNRLVAGLGLVSYPLYLWHWPLLAMAAIVYGEPAPANVRGAILVLSLLLAILTYLLVERPLHARRPTLLQSGVLVTLLMALGGAGLFVVRHGGLPSRASIAAYQDPEAWFTKVEAWPYAENADCLKRFPSADRRERWWFCVINRDAPPNVFVMGNSFANHLYPGLAASEELSGNTILQFGTCDPGMGLRFSAYVKGSPCHGDGRRVQEEFNSHLLETTPSIKFVILSAPWPRFSAAGEVVAYFDESQVDGEYRSAVGVPGESSYDAYMAALERRVVFLIERGVTPVLVLGTPQLPYSPRTCYSEQPFRPGVNSCVVSKVEELEKQARFRAGVEEIRGRHSALLVFDPLVALCGAATCELKTADGPLTRDKGHLSIAGSRVVGDAFVDWARTNLPGVLKRQ